MFTGGAGGPEPVVDITTRIDGERLALEITNTVRGPAPTLPGSGFGLAGMRERGRGTIVNVLSAGARMPTPNFAAYMASKAALSQLPPQFQGLARRLEEALGRHDHFVQATVLLVPCV